MVPIVAFDQLYSFDRDALIRAIPRPENMAEDRFGAAAGEVFDRILQMTDNAGATDDHRAKLFGDALSRHLRQGGGRVRARLFAKRRGSASLALERHAQHRRGHLFLHQPQYGFHREVLCPRRRDRGISVPGHQAVAVLRRQLDT
jgi:hypothetical protein